MSGVRDVSDARRFGVLLEVAYDGTAFHGWAAQEGTRTVHEALAGAIRAMDERASPPRGASRTDAGVHAEGQLAAFDATREIPARGWVLGLNQHLPDDLAIRRARAVEPAYNPRFLARQKRYRYRLLLDPVRDPYWRGRAWRVEGPVDLEKMAREARAAEGTHDFSGFRSAGDERQETVRTLTRVAIEPGPDPRIASIVVEGNAFLYNMVRILVGTLVDVARGRLEEGRIAQAITAKDRRVAGTTAPAHGLTLERVDVDLPSDAGEPWPR